LSRFPVLARFPRFRRSDQWVCFPVDLFECAIERRTLITRKRFTLVILKYGGRKFRVTTSVDRIFDLLGAKE
jgi:hypothetical protein